MSADELTQRVRRLLRRRRSVSEKRMFGGTCFLLRGNMLCGTSKGRLMARVGKDQHAAALARPGARPMDFTGTVMKGFVWVDAKHCDARSLARWIVLAEDYVGTLPVKKGKK